MAHILSAVTGDIKDIIKPTRALISVSDKTGLIPLVTFLHSINCEILSTGGTAAKIREAGIPCIDVSTYTGSPECLDGRVKTLHPKIHGGLLAVRGNPQHEADRVANDIGNIDITILNLYPFNQTVASGATFSQCIENIDIGGPSMLRSTSKNHAFTTIVTNPNQYDELIAELGTKGGSSLNLRKRFAAAAFALSASYDASIASYFAEQLLKEAKDSEDEAILKKAQQEVVVPRVYKPEYPLKYGCNPHQAPSSIMSIVGSELPFKILNGRPGYINLLDAANAYQLVLELSIATNLAAATSFKHVSPAGAAVAIPLSEAECQAYEFTVEDAAKLTPSALAYVRARNADPMCSFGDFAAISEVVDKDTAMFLKREVSDGIIAKGYTEEALDILKTKKSGNFIILEATEGYKAPELEYREVYGMVMTQKRNDIKITSELMDNVVTKKSGIPASAKLDCLVSTITLKYTQSNSVSFAINGQCVGVGAGQQSRVDCVKLAGRKVQTWALRQHPKVLALDFKAGVKRQDRVNARVRFIEGDFTAEEKGRFLENFNAEPTPLSQEEKATFMAEFKGVTISSDAFFPFRDGVDVASRFGVSYVAQPGGSVQDANIIETCEEYGMGMCFTGTRLFHH